MKLSIVVPCYNEEENIPLLLHKLNDVTMDRDIEVIFVNNGSTDDSGKIFKKLIPQYSFAKLVKVKVNKGYGYGILQGLERAEGEYIGWTHADLQADPNDVARAYDYLVKTSKNNLFIKGNRKGRPFFDQVFTWGMGLFESILFQVNLYDINAQPNIFPAEFYHKWINPPTDFSLDLYALYMAEKSGLDVARFPVGFESRLYGTSKWNTSFSNKIKFIRKTLEYSIELRKRGP